MPAIFYRITAIAALLPFAALMAIGRLPENVAPGEVVFINFQVTMLLCLALAFLGAYASRKSSWMNLNAVHGLMGVIQTFFLCFAIFHPWLIALAVSFILAPLAYLLITGWKNSFKKPHKDPVTGNPVVSEITVWDVMTGKWKPEDGPRK